MESCTSSERRSEALLEDVWKVELVDSLVLDYLGQVYLQDISPDGSTFLGYDQSNEVFLVFSKEGELIRKLDLNGEGPGEYGSYHTGKTVFMGNNSFLLISERGQFQYDLQGRLVREFKPDFPPMFRFIVPYAKNTVPLGGDFVSFYQGRYADLGFTMKHQSLSRQLERLDPVKGVFEPLVPFPKESRFSSETHLFHDVYIKPVLTSSGDTLFVSFSNEPKIFAYTGDFSKGPVSEQSLPFEVFYQAVGVEEESGDGAFGIVDFYYGKVKTLDYLSSNRFLIGYSEGAPPGVVKELYAAHQDDIMKCFEEVGKINKEHLRVWDGKVLSADIVMPEYFGLLAKVRGDEEVWFDVDFQERENDYTVFYKTRLVKE
ncbi:hypothetical protein GCM10028791_00140 [Echinicola sediminis]